MVNGCGCMKAALTQLEQIICVPFNEELSGNHFNTCETCTHMGGGQVQRAENAKTGHADTLVMLASSITYLYRST